MIIQWNSIGLNEVYRSSAGNAECFIGQDQQDWEQHLRMNSNQSIHTRNRFRSNPQERIL